MTESQVSRGVRPYSRMSRAAAKISLAVAHPLSPIIVIVSIGAFVGLSAFLRWSEAVTLLINLIGIVFFLLLFVIQNSQERNNVAMHLKINELIRVQDGAHNALLDLERLGDQDYESIESGYQMLAHQAREHLRGGRVWAATAVVEIRSLDALCDPQHRLGEAKRLSVLEEFAVIGSPPEDP